MTATVIYTRLSLDRTGEQVAVARQEADCRKLAEAKGWDVDDVLSDNDKSASVEGVVRPDFEKLVELVAAGEVTRLVIWHLDRLVRKMTDLMRLIEAGKKYRLNIAGVHGVSLDLGDPTGVAVAQILTAIAGMESAHKANRQRAASLDVAERGLPPARPAYGYSPDGMTVDPVTGPVVKELFDSVLAGAAIAELVRGLNEAGRTTTMGTPWIRSTLLALLKNPRYAAIRTLDVREPGRSVVKQEIGPGCWPAIVTKDQFDAVQEILSAPERKSNKSGTARKWLGGSLFLCDVCGSLVVTTSRGGGLRTYSCRSGVKHVSRLAEPIDELVLELVTGRLGQADEVAALIAPDVSSELSALRTEAETLRTRKDRLAADYADGLLDGRQLKVASDRIDARLSEVERQLSRHARSSGLTGLLAAPDPAAAFLEAPLSVQRQVVDTLCTVRIRTGVGGRQFDPATVGIVWR